MSCGSAHGDACRHGRLAWCSGCDIVGTVVSVNSTYLLVLSEREAIAWVLSEQRMAFPASRSMSVRTLAVGDGLLLYATRDAWHRPIRDRGRIFGAATVASTVSDLDVPVEIAERQFGSACELRIDGVVPYPGGLELQPLVHKLAAFPKPEAWSAYMRRTLVSLPGEDATLLRDLLAPMLTTRRQALQTYHDAVPRRRRGLYLSPGSGIHDSSQ